MPKHIWTPADNTIVPPGAPVREKGNNRIMGYAVRGSKQRTFSAEGNTGWASWDDNERIEYDANSNNHITPPNR